MPLTSLVRRSVGVEVPPFRKESSLCVEYLHLLLSYTGVGFSFFTEGITFPEVVEEVSRPSLQLCI